MKTWHLLHARNPLWRTLGTLLILGTLAGSAYFLYNGPKPLEPKDGGETLIPAAEGRMGSYVQQLGTSRFTLGFETMRGSEEELRLQNVSGRLEEPGTHWALKSPCASKANNVWLMDGPMELEVQEPERTTILGKGSMPGPGPALRWDRGVWTGLSTLEWDDLAGPGKGHWTLPPGWHRELDGRFVADKGPVTWKAADPDVLHSFVASRLWVTLGFQEGHLEDVEAQLKDGQVHAGATDMDAGNLRWSPPIRFVRNDGWHGEAASGWAPRPEPGKAMEKLELRGYKALRETPAGTETLEAEGVRWTGAGLRLEGGVRWLQPLDGERLSLRAPRVLIREGLGPDLPEELPVGEAWGEGTAVLSWGNRSLSSPRIEVRRHQRSWRIQAPCLGRAEQGTFSAGKGEGNPRKWEFEGPIRASLITGGSLRGDRLTWEDEVWTFRGRLATWTQARHRLAGSIIIRRNEVLRFPEGLSGTLGAQEGDLTIRSDRAEGTPTQIVLEGRVECGGQGWRLKAERIVATLGPGQMVQTLSAKGSVSLQGSLGEGWGQALELDLTRGARAKWLGKVSGIAEVQP